MNMAAWRGSSPLRICWNRLLEISATSTRWRRRSRSRNGNRAACGWFRGSFPVGQLADLFGESAGLSDLDDAYEATTLGGLVSEIEGRIPLSGEVVMLEPIGLRMEVVASTDRRVERLRVFPPHGERDTSAPANFTSPDKK